jgi:hypothetical protein
MDRRIKLETNVSLASLQVLHGSPLPKAAPVALWIDLQYLQERRESASQVLASDSLLAHLTSTLSPDNVIERYSQIALEDPINEIPSINHFKDCCARLLIDNLESLEEWNAIAATLIDNGRDLLARGMQEHLEEIHHQDATDDTLFAALSDPEPTIPITVAAGLLLSRAKEHLQAHDSVADQPLPENPHKQWLQRFASLAPQIADYSRLDIKGLDPDQLGWLLDCIAPHALTLNLSGFNEASDASLWTRKYPKLQSLEMRDCAALATFGGKRSHLPNLKNLDLSGGSRIRSIADGSGLSLSRLDVSHCPHWTHVAFFTNNVSDWLNVTGCKSEVAKSTQRLAPIRPGLSILSEIAPTITA